MASTTCGHCERLSHFTDRWGEIVAPRGLVQVAATCDNCGRLAVISGEEPHGYGAQRVNASATNDFKMVKSSLESAHSLEWWPRVGVAPEVEDVPPHIARASREAYSSASIGNHMAAILMARTVVEATAKAKEISKGSLFDKINAMRDAQLIRPAIAEQAHEVRFAGNDMAHGDIDFAPDATDSEEILALMGEVLSEVFQGPARLARIRAKRGEGA